MTTPIAQWANSIDIERHIIGLDPRGSEENVKLKLVVPYLELLEWNTLQDMYFEEQGADILLKSEQKPLVVIEVKSWEHSFGNKERAQLLEYTLKHQTPWAVFTSGDRVLFFHAIGLDPSLNKVPSPLVAARYRDWKRGIDPIGPYLTKRLWNAMLEDLETLALGSMGKVLGIETREALDATWQALLQKSRPKRYTPAKMSPDKFAECLKALPARTRDSYELLYKVLLELSRSYGDKVRLEYKSKSIGLHMIDPTFERVRSRGLFGIYPENGQGPHVSSGGVDGWDKLGVKRDRYRTLQKLVQSFNKEPDKKLAHDICSTMRSFLGKST